MSKASVTPLQIAKHGHVAEVIRREMLARGMTLNQIGKALGTTGTAVSHWIRCQNGPGEAMRQRLAKFLDMRPDDFKAKAVSEIVAGNSQAKLPGQAIQPIKRQDILSFTIDSEGMARLKLDVVLPIEHGVPLFRVLLDTGIVRRPGDGPVDPN